VAVVDSGWDRSIDESRVEQGIGFVGTDPRTRLAASSNDRDRLGHGTACADIVLQIAPEARIVPIRVFDRNLEASPDALIAAIDWAVESRLPLINLSLYTARRDIMVSLYRSCELASRAGTIVVAAQGMGLTEPSFPSAFEPVIGVGMRTDGAPRDIFEATDPLVDCDACGIQRARGLGGAVQSFGGSSFATAVVTGHIARFLAEVPTAGIEAVRSMLHAVAKPL
jgi:subtilisin